MKRCILFIAMILGWLSFFICSLNAQAVQSSARRSNLRPPENSTPKDRIGEKGPLVTNNIYPFYIPFINLIPESAQTLGQAHHRFILALNYANTFRYDYNGVRSYDNFEVKLDVETSHLSLSYDFGLLKNFDVGVDWSLTAHYGGFFDPLIQFYHNFLGFYNSNREIEENNNYTLLVKSDNGTWLKYSSPVIGFGDVQLRTKIGLIYLDKAGFSLALQPALKIPTGDVESFLSSGKFDFSFQVLITQILFHSAIYLNAGYIYVGRPDNLKLVDFRNQIFSYVLGFELIASRQLSLYTQIDGSTSPYKAGHFWLDSPSSTINFGFKSKLSTHYCLQASFSEEFLTFSTTDVALLLALLIEY